MTSIISRCSICGQFFNSIKELKNHKDKNHRITDANMRNRVNDNRLGQPWSFDPT
jgi:hypothetical protein